MKPLTKISAARLTTVLATLLGLAYMLVLTGRIADDNSPSVANTSSGGLSAFAALLRQSGFRVRVVDTMRGSFAPNEFVVVSIATSGLQAMRAMDEDRSLAKTLPKMAGGAMLLGQSSDPSSVQSAIYVNRMTKERLNVSVGRDAGSVLGLESLAPLVILYKEDGRESGIESAMRDGSPITIVERGEMASNGHLDGPQNAALLVGLLRRVAGDRTIVFYEGTDRGGGLLASLGDWAFAARNQILLGVGLLVLTLGSRFGLAPTARRKETGQREQSDALGNLLRRWRGPQVGIEAAIEQARRRLAVARKLPPSAPRDQWIKYLSPALIDAIEECEEWSRQGAKEGEAIRAIAKLNGETDAEIMGTTASPRVSAQ